MRHTFGHRFLVKGGDIYELSKILGHSSVAVTERHYAYLRREDVAAKHLAIMDPRGSLGGRVASGRTRGARLAAVRVPRTRTLGV